MTDLKTSAIVLPGIINTALKLGVDIRGILKRFDIHMDWDDISQATIDLTKVHAVVQALEEAAQFPAIGLRSGEDFDFEYLPHLKTYLMSAPTLREAFAATRHMQQLISSLLVLDLQETATEAVLTLQPDERLSDEDERRYAEMVFSAVKTTADRLLKQKYAPRKVRFRHGRLSIAPLYEAFFNCPVELGAEDNSLIYDRTLMDIPLPGAFPEIRRQAGKVVKRQSAESPLQGGIEENVRRVLTRQNELLNAPVAQVARALNMSTRTLQRRLAEQGLSLADLRDQIRFQLAAKALQSNRENIEEISEKLGFSDRHSFTRAFKRWSGFSPSNYRKNIK